jgi:hypothetical protein
MGIRSLEVMNRELLAFFIVHKAVVLQIRGFPWAFFLKLYQHHNLFQSKRIYI